MRQALKVLEGKAKGKLYEWNKDFDGKEDKAIYHLLNRVFDEDELKNIINNLDSILGVPQLIQNAIEYEILSEMNEWIFGKRLAKMSFEEQKRLDIILNCNLREKKNSLT